MNNQPMGFYPVETLKQDARRFGVPFLNPCVNLGASPRASPESGSVQAGAPAGQGRGYGVREAHRGGEGASRTLRDRRGPGPSDRD